MVSSRLAEVAQDWVDELESLVDLLTDLGAGQDDFAADEDEQNLSWMLASCDTEARTTVETDDLWLHHAVDEAREEFRLVAREVVMGAGKTLETDRELDVARANDVLDLEVGELGVEAELLDDARVLARCQLAVGLALCAGDDHLPRGEDQRRGLGVSDTHDDGSETLRVVLGVARMQCDRLEIQAAGEVDGGDQVLQLRRDARGGSAAMLVRRRSGRR